MPLLDAMFGRRILVDHLERLRGHFSPSLLRSFADLAHGRDSFLDASRTWLLRQRWVDLSQAHGGVTGRRRRARRDRHFQAVDKHGDQHYYMKWPNKHYLKINTPRRKPSFGRATSSLYEGARQAGSSQLA